MEHKKFTADLFGDPHVITSDGVNYTFNGLGEYYFTIIDEDTVIQARTERVKKPDGSRCRRCGG